MKKLLLIAFLGSFLFTSCYNYNHRRTNWSKDTTKKVLPVKPS